MFVCMCMYARVIVCVYVSVMYICNVCVHCMFVRTYVRMYVCLYVCMLSIHQCLRVCVCVCVYVCVCTHVDVCI